MKLKALAGKCYELHNTRCFIVLFSELLVLKGHVICIK